MTDVCVQNLSSNPKSAMDKAAADKVAKTT